MADCINGVFGVINYDLAAKSGVYAHVKSAAEVDDSGTSVPVFSRPALPEFHFAAEIDATADAQLHEAIQVDGGFPQAMLTTPQLEQVAYSALSSLVNYGHDNPLVDDVSYLSSVSNISLPFSTPPAPPSNYPQNRPYGNPGNARYDAVRPPILKLGQKPTLVSLQPIDFTPSGIRPLDFSELMPEYEPPDIDELAWQPEVRYDADEGFRDKLTALMAGDDEIAHWIGEQVQRKLYISEIRGLDRRTKRQLDAYMADMAARNFSLPHGPTEALVLMEAERELEDSYRAAQRVRDEVYTAARNALVEAIRQSLEVERYHFKLYIRYLRQNLRVYQVNVQLATDVYNGLLRIYGLLERTIGPQVSAYNQYVRAVSAENSAIPARLDFVQIESEEFRSRVQMYEADVRLRQRSGQVRVTDLEYQALSLQEYQSKLRASVADLIIVEQNLEAFRSAIQARADSTQWLDTALAAHEAHVDAGASQVGVTQANYDSYRRLWRAEGGRLDAYQQYLQASTSALDALLSDYRDGARAQLSYFSDVQRALSLGQQAVGAYESAMRQSADSASAHNAASVSYTGAQNAVSVAAGTRDMAQQAIQSEAEGLYASLDTANEAARVTAAGALSQAASAIFQVGLSATGGATNRVSGRDSGGTRADVSDRKSFSKSCEYIERPSTT